MLKVVIKSGYLSKVRCSSNSNTVPKRVCVIACPRTQHDSFVHFISRYKQRNYHIHELCTFIWPRGSACEWWGIVSSHSVINNLWDDIFKLFYNLFRWIITPSKKIQHALFLLTVIPVNICTFIISTNLFNVTVHLHIFAYRDWKSVSRR